MPDLVGVFREPEFSPGRVRDDAAILERTADALAARGLAVRLGGPDLLAGTAPGAVLAMCQAPAALAALDRHAGRVPVVNAPTAIRACYRAETARLLAAAGLPVPRTRLVASTGTAPVDAAPCWVKRGDVHAMTAADVVLAPDAAALAAALADFRTRGIEQAVLQEHVPGTVVKFYGVGGRFFRCYTDGAAPPALIPALAAAARAGAACLGLEVFGGDLVVPPDGAPALVDVNDWPSFARCRDEAAEAIADHLCERLAAAAPARRAADAR